MPVFNEDIALLRDSARQWAAAQGLIDEEVDYKALWREMVALGWAAIAIDEAHGGAGLGLAGVAEVVRELGRERIDSPLITHSLLAPALVRGLGDEQQQRHWLAVIAGGDDLFAVAVDDAAIDATCTSRGWFLNGEKRFVAGGAAADLYITTACVQGSDELAVFVVGADRVQRQSLSMVDGSNYARLRFVDVEVTLAERLGTRDSRAEIDAALDLGRIAVASEMLGLAQSALDTTVEYLRTREQFGQPIGSFQALQHRAAQAYSQLQVATACVEAAIDAVHARQENIAQLASLAKAMAGDALHLISNEIVQMHGGIGMTDEHVAGRVLKRARVLETWLGNSSLHAQRYATLCGF